MDKEANSNTEKPDHRCKLSDADLIEKANWWVSKLAETGGGAWTLRVPVDYDYDPDMIFVELGKRLKERSEENERLKATILKLINGSMNPVINPEEV